MAHYTIYGITKDGTYAANGGGFTAGDLYDDAFAAYHYDSWTTVKEDDGEVIQEFADLFAVGNRRPAVSRDEDWWCIELDQETIDAYLQEMWRRFSAALQEAQKITQADMKDWYHPALRDMSDAFSCSDEDMIYDMENGWLTPQEFIRLAKPGTRYYICGAVDAHC